LEKAIFQDSEPEPEPEPEPELELELELELKLNMKHEIRWGSTLLRLRDRYRLTDRQSAQSHGSGNNNDGKLRKLQYKALYCIMRRRDV